jgi:hypothetical protein
MRYSCLSLAAILITGLTVGAPVEAATFTTSILPTVQTGPRGYYLAGSFDFGVEFREIQAVLLEFTMPEGFEGTSVNSAYSHTSSSLQMGVHDIGTMPAEYFRPDEGLEDSTILVSPGVESQVLLMDFTVYSMAEGWQIPPPAWPTFLYGGEGQVSMFVVNDYWTKIPGGVSTLIFTAWSLPPDVENLRLVVHGTAVPEPGALGLLMVLGALAPLRCTTSRG